MKNSEKTLDMIVNLCKTAGSSIRAAKSTAAWQTAGTTVLWVLSSRTMTKGMDEEVRAGKPLQCRSGCRHPDEPADLGHHRPRVQLLDPLLDCRACKSRHRADKLISECEQGKGVDVDAMTFDEMDAFIASQMKSSAPSAASMTLPHP